MSIIKAEKQTLLKKRSVFFHSQKIGSRMKTKFWMVMIILCLLAGCSKKQSPDESILEYSSEYSEEETVPPDPTESASSAHESEDESSRPETTTEPEAFSTPTEPSTIPTPPAPTTKPTQPPTTAPPPATVPKATNPTASSSTASPGQSTALEAVEREILVLVNAERASLGLGSLAYDANLTKAARIRSKELYDNNYFAHTRPNGDVWSTVLKKDVPLNTSAAGENLAQIEHNMPDRDPTYEADYWFSTWKNSPSHYENMIRAGFTHAGVAIYYKKENGMIYAYATNLFATY